MRQLLAAEKNVQYITSVQKISASIDTALHAILFGRTMLKIILTTEMQMTLSTSSRWVDLLLYYGLSQAPHSHFIALLLYFLQL